MDHTTPRERERKEGLLYFVFAYDLKGGGGGEEKQSAKSWEILIIKP